MSSTFTIDQLGSPRALLRLIGERGVQLLVLVLLLAIGLDSALILTRLLSGAAAPAGPTVGALPFDAHARNPQLLLATIVDGHLFGSAQAAAGGSDAPPTTMQLILTGVIADRNQPNRGEAIIGANAADAKLYSVGAAISGGAHLHAVYSDRVLLERDGRLETLMLPRTPLPGGRSTQAAAVGTEGYRSSNPALLAGLVRVQPVFSQGKLSGYRIFPGPHGAHAFTQLGLHPGDLILAINGTSLDDPTQALQVLQTLSTAGSATVTVSRNGTPQEVNLNLAELSQDEQAGAADSGSAASQPPSSPGGGTLPMRRRPLLMRE